MFALLLHLGLEECTCYAIVGVALERHNRVHLFEHVYCCERLGVDMATVYCVKRWSQKRFEVPFEISKEKKRSFFVDCSNRF